MGYGTSPYGLTAFGGISSTLTVVNAWAISTHAVRVELSGEPAHVDSFDEGDALNPLTWTLNNITAGRPLTIVMAAVNSSTTVDLTTLEALGDHLETHTATAVGLLSLTGVPAVAPLSASFPGVVQTVDPVDTANLDFRDRDFANPPFQTARGLGAAGTLIIGADGDFATESGAALTRKLVLRRMSTPRGAFRHLPNYGVADLEKEPVGSAGDLVAKLREYEQQAKQEPDVVDAKARGSIDRSGVLIVQLAIATTGGANVNVRMGQRDGRLVEI